MAKSSALWEALDAASADLVDGRPSRLTPDQARRLNLGAWCFHTASADSSYRRALADDFLQDWMRHRRRMQLLAPLLEAWAQAGVRVCAFKGAAMALLAYSHPAIRFSGDVDLVIDPEQADAARQCVTGDWAIVTEHINSDIAFNLSHRSEFLLVEVHRCLVPMSRMGRRRSAEVTRHMMDAASEVSVELGPGRRLDVLCLSPVDLMLSLVLNRSWSADAWRHKPHDYLDLHGLATAHGIDVAQLRARARQLRIASTVEQFLGACNPWSGRLDLTSAYRSRWHRWKRDLALLPHAVPPQLMFACERWIRAPGVIRRMLIALPVVFQVMRELERDVAPDQAAGRVVRVCRAPWRPDEVDRAVEWAARLLRPWAPKHLAGPCVLHSLSVHRILQSMGLPSTWQLGHAVAPDGTRRAHAWVMTDDPFAFGAGYEMAQRPYRVARRVSADVVPPPPASPAEHALHPPS